VPPDVTLAPTAEGHCRPASRLTWTTRPPKRARLIWSRALELADRPAPRAQFVLALDLLRAAHHDPATVSRAVTIGRAHVRAHADDAVALGGVKILEAAAAFIGVAPRTIDANSPVALGS
jgi:hypothetical protein